MPFGTLDVSFYRDDFEHKGLKHKVAPSDIPFEVEGRDLLIWSTTSLYTGRTIRAAMNEAVLTTAGRRASGLRRSSTAAGVSCRLHRNSSARA